MPSSRGGRHVGARAGQPACLRRMMFRALPALNHSICSSFMVWVARNSTVGAVGLVDRRTAPARPGARSASPRTLIVSSSPIGVVGRRVGEGQGQHALLLQVGLVDAGEAAGEDDLGPPEAGLHGGVLAGAALAVVLVADGAPAHALPRAGGGRCRGTGGSRRRAGPCRGPASTSPEGVDRAEEQVAGDVLQVAPVGEPRARGRDVVGGALARRLHQHGQARRGRGRPRGRRARAAAGARCRAPPRRSRSAPSAGGATKPDSPGSKPRAGSCSPTGGSSRTSVAVGRRAGCRCTGSKSSVPASARATTTSGLVTKDSVLALPSLRLGKLRL